MDAALMFGLWLVVTVASNLYWYRQGERDGVEKREKLLATWEPCDRCFGPTRGGIAARPVLPRVPS